MPNFSELNISIIKTKVNTKFFLTKYFNNITMENGKFLLTKYYNKKTISKREIFVKEIFQE